MKVIRNLFNQLKKVVVDHPFLAWVISSIILFILIPVLGVILSLISLLFAIKLNSEKKKRLLMEQKACLIKEANEYIDLIKSRRAIPTIGNLGSIMLEKSENLFLRENVILRETRAVRHSSGSFGSVRVMKGLSIGQYGGTSRSSLEWSNLDVGDLILTNKKILFMGHKENRTFPLKKLMAVETFLDAIEITIDGRSKAIQFPVKNPYIWSTALSIVKSVDNPSDIGDLDLNIQLN